MKASDYIVEFFVSKGITDVFGYPGGMVTHLMDSFDKYSNSIVSHLTYNEQGAAIAACGYAQTTNNVGVAYATSGPGVTNMITGIANAYFDSIPAVFISGQVNVYEQKTGLEVRQKGFQEMEVVSVVAPITKYAVMVDNVKNLPYELEKAYNIAISGRKGPVVLDIPMNIQREDIDKADVFINYETEAIKNLDKEDINEILAKIEKSNRPVIIAGCGIVAAGAKEEFNEFVQELKIPVVSSLMAVDCIDRENSNYFGFIGAYGHRYANMIVAKSDLIISFGSRLDCRQTGTNKDNFAPNAELIRFDIDKGELTNKIKESEYQYLCDCKDVLSLLNKNIKIRKNYSPWLEVCDEIKSVFSSYDNEEGNVLIKKLGNIIPDDAVITTDVGQNQIWVSQSLNIKKNQRVLFSGGHGAMGYSLPAAIGAYYGSGKIVVSLNGDGGVQMNIQELQVIARESIPIKIIVLNNNSLGMIRHFQEMYFDSNFMHTRREKGYTSPDFYSIAKAYGIRSMLVSEEEDFLHLAEFMNDNKPLFVEIKMSDNTYLFPKLSMGRPPYDQDPLIDRVLMKKLVNM